MTEALFDRAQDRRADVMGMWIFLGTEIMLFGGLFMALLTYRIMHSEAAKEAADHFHMWIGALNTAVLLTSSLSMAIAVRAVKYSDVRLARRALWMTAFLGLVFLGFKAMEYTMEFRDGITPGPDPSHLHDRATALFINLYFAATGLHALHLFIGICWISCLAAYLRRTISQHDDAEKIVHLGGLYWHFVDVVWVFLYPTLYLIGRGTS